MSIVRAVKGFMDSLKQAITKDELEPAVKNFCDRLSNPSLTGTRLDDNSYRSFRTKISEAVMRDFQHGDEPLQWTHVAETLMDACLSCHNNASFHIDELRFETLYNYANVIKGADAPSNSPVTIRLGTDSYSPTEFLLKISECQSVSEFRDVFMNASRSPLPKPVFAGNRG